MQSPSSPKNLSATVYTNRVQKENVKTGIPAVATAVAVQFSVHFRGLQDQCRSVFVFLEGHTA